MTAEHLLWKWKARNAVFGFAKLSEADIGEHDACTLGQYLESLKVSSPSDPMFKEMYEPHKTVHIYSKEVIKLVNNGDLKEAEQLLVELDKSSEILLSGLKKDWM